MSLSNTHDIARGNDAEATASVRTIAGVTMDKRTREAKRRAEVIEGYRVALGVDADAPLMSDRIATAAELAVIAESARASLLRGETGVTHSDVVRATRAASLAERALGLDRRLKTRKPDIAEYLRNKAAA
ncbi:MULTISPECIES: hypothetical protein [unclassified Shinella]|uniref:hypothetical protein n=1 Tax=unclassified Shinella TaxID=2643062 RepID=UPI00225D2737|nr:MULTISPECIES: hypothetical protein [unclassified Shinella]MCO5137432.1 hypothetical protein [Shinella sp.]MDC7257390.1 hypothetical protein [Shinella sp. YE25]CAI0340281.1 Exonuclease SbcC [Rhizobiaceae bacterium]